MLDFIISNAATIIVAAVIAGILIFDIIYLIRKKKQGKSVCGCGDCNSCSGCSGCTGCKSCSAVDEKTEKKAEPH